MVSRLWMAPVSSGQLFPPTGTLEDPGRVDQDRHLDLDPEPSPRRVQCLGCGTWGESLRCDRCAAVGVDAPNLPGTAH